MTRSREDPNEFILEEVLDKESRDYTRQRNAEAWKNLLSVEDYVTRENILGLSQITCRAPNRLVVFALKSKENEPSKENPPLCSCELLIRQAWRYFKNSSGAVDRKDVLSGCIGGVYTYEENRGRGLATIMIDKLVEKVKREEFLGADGFTFLYSEVGEFYARNGFKSFHVNLMNLPLSYNGAKHQLRPGFELIKYNEFGDLFELYNEHFDREMRRKVGRDAIDRISISPSSDYVDWFHLRAKYFGVKLFDNEAAGYDFKSETLDSLSHKFQSSEPVYFGLKSVCPETGNPKGFLVWQYDYGYSEKTKEFENYVTLVKSFVDDQVYDAKEVTLELIQAMKEYLEAEHGVPQMSNFHKIVIWESEIPASVKKLLLQTYECRHGLENSSRSAILYNNKEDDDKLRSGGIIWENNTKLPWF